MFLEYTELYRQLFEVIQKIAGEEVIVKKEMNIIEELHFDSIQIVELAVNVEEIFQIELHSFEGLIESFESVDKTIEYFAGIIMEKEKHDSELTLRKSY